MLLVLLGLWGGLAPFVGPYFDFGFAPDETWVYSDARLQLSVLPGAAAALGGLIVLSSANRAVAMFGAWVAALGGAWFVVGGEVAPLWNVNGVGQPLGTEAGRVTAEQLAAFSALGVVIVFLAALALGRFAVVGVKETRMAEEHSGEHDGDGSDTTQPFVPPARYSRTGPKHVPPKSSPWGPVPEDTVDDRKVAGERREQPY